MQGRREETSPVYAIAYTRAFRTVIHERFSSLADGKEMAAGLNRRPGFNKTRGGRLRGRISILTHDFRHREPHNLPCCVAVSWPRHSSEHSGRRARGWISGRGGRSGQGGLGSACLGVDPWVSAYSYGYSVQCTSVLVRVSGRPHEQRW